MATRKAATNGQGGKSGPAADPGPLKSLAAHLDYLADCLDTYLPSAGSNGKGWPGSRLPPGRKGGLWAHIACLAAWRVERILNPECVAFDAAPDGTQRTLRTSAFNELNSLEMGAVVWFVRAELDSLYAELGWQFLCGKERPVEFRELPASFRNAPPEVPTGVSDDFRRFARMLRAPIEIPDLLLHLSEGNSSAELSKLYGPDDVEWSLPMTKGDAKKILKVSLSTLNRRIVDKSVRIKPLGGNLICIPADLVPAGSIYHPGGNGSSRPG